MNYRGYIVKSDPLSPSLLTIATEGQGGRIPDKFQGRFTSHLEVKGLIDRYLDIDKEQGNAKTNSKSRG